MPPALVPRADLPVRVAWPEIGIAPHDLSAVLAANIRRVAAERGMALNSLADFAGVTRSHLFAVLAGDSYPTIEWVAKIAAVLEVEPWRLLKPAVP